MEQCEGCINNASRLDGLEVEFRLLKNNVTEYTDLTSKFIEVMKGQKEPMDKLLEGMRVLGGIVQGNVKSISILAETNCVKEILKEITEITKAKSKVS